MKLAQGEQILKEWNYAKSKQKGKRDSASLIVTNKRIVSDIAGNRGETREEIPISSVKSLAMKNQTPDTIKAVFMIVFGLVLAAVGIGLGVNMNPVMFAFSGMGIVLLIVGIVILTRISFVLIIFTEGIEGTPLSVGASSSASKGKKPKGKIKVKVNKASVLDMFDSLGAIVFTYKK